MSNGVTIESVLNELKSKQKVSKNEIDIISNIASNTNDPTKCMQYIEQLIKSYTPEDRKCFKTFADSGKFTNEQIELLKALKLID